VAGLPSELEAEVEEARRFDLLLEFANLIVDHLTEHGVMEARLLDESPFADLTPAVQTGC